MTTTLRIVSFLITTMASCAIQAQVWYRTTISSCTEVMNPVEQISLAKSHGITLSLKDVVENGVVVETTEVGLDPNDIGNTSYRTKERCERALAQQIRERQKKIQIEEQERQQLRDRYR